MQRRRLLKLGVVSAAVLTVAGGGLLLWKPGLQAGRLTAAGREVFGAVARAVLDGVLPADASALDGALAAHLDRLDSTITGLAPAAQVELAELTSLLASVPGRLALTGLSTDWSRASTPELQHMLQELRLSSLSLRQQSYHALRDLTSAAYFADPAAWAFIGYPGPSPV